MAIKGGHCQNELFSLCQVKQQILFSSYYMYSPVISTMGYMGERRYILYTSKMYKVVGEIKHLRRVTYK